MRLLPPAGGPDEVGPRGRQRRVPAIFTLRALEAAVRHRSYSRAANELAVTHSAVSQQIRKLEDELGATLFVRKAGAMLPTPDAQRLAGAVTRAMGVLQDAIIAFDEGPTQPLVLSVESMLARRWLPQRLPRLLARANVEVRVDNGHANFTTDGVDVGIRYGPGDWKGLESRQFLPMMLTPICSPDFARRHGLRTPRDLARAPLVHREGRPWSLWFEAQGLPTPPERGLMFDDTLMLLEAAVAGLGAGLLAEPLLEAELEAGRLVRPLAEEVASPFSFYLVWRPDSRKADRILQLYDWLLAEVRAGRPTRADHQAA